MTNGNNNVKINMSAQTYCILLDLFAYKKHFSSRFFQELISLNIYCVKFANVVKNY